MPEVRICQPVLLNLFILSGIEHFVNSRLGSEIVRDRMVSRLLPSISPPHGQRDVSQRDTTAEILARRCSAGAKMLLSISPWVYPTIIVWSGKLLESSLFFSLDRYALPMATELSELCTARPQPTVA